MKTTTSIFALAGILLSLDQRDSKSSDLELLCIRNHDGTPRWVWPRHLHQPLFLHCYNQGGRKAHLYAYLIRIVFALRLQAWMFEKVRGAVAHKDAETPLFPVLGDWALFTGTPGPQQKAIFVIKEADQNVRFLKLGIGKRSLATLNNEVIALSHVQSMGFTTFRVPQLLASAHGMLSLSSVGDGGHRMHALQRPHRRALAEIAAKTARKMPIAQLSAWGEMVADLTYLHRLQDARIPQGMLRKLDQLLDSLDEEKTIQVAMSHGDFTPWNMYVADDALRLYDWEQWRPSMPMGYDAFHFVMQSGILMGRQSWNAIAAEMEERIHLELWPALGVASDAQYQLYVKLYLLFHTVQSLRLYSAQSVWHTQVQWLLDTWNQGLSAMLVGTTSGRSLLLMDAFDWLAQRQYAALKFPPIYPEQLSVRSDVDLCLHKADALAMQEWIVKHPLAAKTTVRKQSFMHQMQVITFDGSVLSLDLIWDLRRKSLQMMNASALIEQNDLNRLGVRVPRALDQARQIALFYALNGATVPSRYTAYEGLLAASTEPLDRLLYPYFLGESAPSAALESHLRGQKINRGWQGLLGRLRYVVDTLRSWIGQNGYTITFSGVDGAGKSTVLAEVSQQLEKQLRRKVVVLRHRPSILPILSAWRKGKAQAEREAATRLPRLGTNSSPISSMLRFAYYYTDYLLGQFFIQFKYVNRGYIVLYDRYYFDFITDSRRSNLVLPPAIARMAYRLLLKPDLNIFLYAAPELVHARKQELDPATIKQLTADYLKLFEALGASKGTAQYVVIENVVLERTLTTIMDYAHKMVA